MGQFLTLSRSTPLMYHSYKLAMPADSLYCYLQSWLGHWGIEGGAQLKKVMGYCLGMVNGRDGWNPDGTAITTEDYRAGKTVFLSACYPNADGTPNPLRPYWNIASPNVRNGLVAWAYDLWVLTKKPPVLFIDDFQPFDNYSPCWGTPESAAVLWASSFKTLLKQLTTKLAGTKLWLNTSLYGYACANDAMVVDMVKCLPVQYVMAESMEITEENIPRWVKLAQDIAPATLTPMIYPDVSKWTALNDKLIAASGRESLMGFGVS